MAGRAAHSANLPNPQKRPTVRQMLMQMRMPRMMRPVPKSRRHLTTISHGVASVGGVAAGGGGGAAVKARIMASRQNPQPMMTNHRMVRPATATLRRSLAAKTGSPDGHAAGAVAVVAAGQRLVTAGILLLRMQILAIRNLVMRVPI